MAEDNLGGKPFTYEGQEVVAILKMNVEGYHVCRMEDGTIKNIPVDEFDPESFQI